jgi:hypothetical protein
MRRVVRFSLADIGLRSSVRSGDHRHVNPLVEPSSPYLVLGTTHSRDFPFGVFSFGLFFPVVRVPLGFFLSGPGW